MLLEQELNVGEKYCGKGRQRKSEKPQSASSPGLNASPVIRHNTILMIYA